VFSAITMRGGASAANTTALNRALAPFPDAKVQTEQQFIDAQEASIDSALNLLYILLALSIIVSLIGIINTLVLTVFERTRELGMLRAIGMSRRQTRSMIRHEAVITALLGAALGIPTGAGLAALFDHALHHLPFAIPWPTILAFLAAAVLVGLIAAILPARRASRLDILDALRCE
jgi:putative ABC transport system permease protein